LPVPQEWPQAPQFWPSVWTLMQVPLHSSWPELQVVPVAGLAQPETNRPALRVATKAKRQALRASIFQTPYGGFGATTTARGRPATGTSLRSRDRRDAFSCRGPKCGGYRTHTPLKPQPVFHQRRRRLAALRTGAPDGVCGHSDRPDCCGPYNVADVRSSTSLPEPFL